MQELHEYIKNLMHEQDLSLIELSDKLGYKSKTSVDRLMNANTRPSSIRKFEKALLDAFSFTPSEIEELHRVIQIAIYGREKYQTSLKMWDFIQGAPAPESHELCVVDGRSGEFVRLTERYAAAKGMRITVMNCQYVLPLFPILKQLLQTKENIVEHYIHVTADSVRTVCAVNALMSIFYEPGYSPYVRKEKAGAMECGLNGADMMTAAWQDADGESHVDIILFSGADQGVLLRAQPDAGDFMRLAGVRPENYAPIKRTYFECNAFEDYIKYSTDYAMLEKNRSIWKIKPDVGVDQIPAWILKRAVQEGPIPQDESFAAVLDALEEVYRRRYENTCSKRKHVYDIFKRNAMYKFAMTGKTSDHFWGMRPYTPQERLVILSDLLKQQTENPYVHMYFLKDDSALRDVEIAYYEGVGMLILESDTDYALAQGHSEILITHEEMLSLYREFFMDILLKEYVLPEQETCNFLRSLIEAVSRM